MNLFDALRDALYNSSTKIITSNTVIHSHQGGQEPNGTYCSINVLRADKIGMEDESSYASDDGTTTEINSISVYEATVRFMFVGNDAGNLAFNFETVADNPASRFHFGTEDLAIMRKSEVRRVPEKRDTTWIENYTLDIVFSYAVRTSQPIDVIENVSWNENIL